AGVGQNDPWAVDLMADMSVTAQRPLNWNALGVMAARLDEVYEQLNAGDVARERGGRVVTLTVPTTSGIRLNFETGFLLDMVPGGEDIMSRRHAEKLELFADPEVRAQMKETAKQPFHMSVLTNWPALKIYDVVAPRNEPYRGRMLGDIAAEEGRDPW